MIFKFKINPNSSQNEWVGWFGENIIKVRITGEKQKIFDNFYKFLKEDLGINQDSYKVINENQQTRLITLDLPDISWELFLSIIEK